jgi:hypothetical protein
MGKEKFDYRDFVEELRLVCDYAGRKGYKKGSLKNVSVFLADPSEASRSVMASAAEEEVRFVHRMVKAMYPLAPPDFFTSRSRNHYSIWPRHVAAYAAIALGHTQQLVGDLMGRNHATVYHAVNNSVPRWCSDKYYEALIATAVSDLVSRVGALREGMKEGVDFNPMEHMASAVASITPRPIPPRYAERKGLEKLAQSREWKPRPGAYID